jgi:hypothetical protein
MPNIDGSPVPLRPPPETGRIRINEITVCQYLQDYPGRTLADLRKCKIKATEYRALQPGEWYIEPINMDGDYNAHYLSRNFRANGNIYYRWIGAIVQPDVFVISGDLRKHIRRDIQDFRAGRGSALWTIRELRNLPTRPAPEGG